MHRAAGRAGPWTTLPCDRVAPEAPYQRRNCAAARLGARPGGTPARGSGRSTTIASPRRGSPRSALRLRASSDAASERPCPCGSGRKFRKCCRTTQGFSVRPARTTPRPPRTRYAVPGCYAGTLNDCGGPLTDEHYFSKTLMKALARASSSRTILFLRPGRPARNTVPEAAMHGRILCRRHNNVLTDLDRGAALLFESMQQAVKLFPDYPCRLCHGANLELWLLKAACGVLADGQDVVPDQWVRWLFGVDAIQHPRGLYMHADFTRTFTPRENGLEFGMFRNSDGWSGIVARFPMMSFTLDVSGQQRTVLPDEVNAARLHRPLGAWFDQGGATRFYLAFDWGTTPATQTSIVFTVL